MLARTVAQNLTNFALPSTTSERRLYTLMVDDVSHEARRRPSAYTNKMLGYGRESDFSGVVLDVRSHADLQALKVGEDSGRLRLWARK